MQSAPSSSSSSSSSVSSAASQLLSAIRDLSAATDKAVKLSSELARIQQSNASTSDVTGASLARAQKLRREVQVHTFRFVVTFTETQAQTRTCARR
jgi:mevalonate kinase